MGANPFPYVLTIWRGGYVDLGRFARFELAAAAYHALADDSKQLANVDRCELGNSGLTDDEREILDGNESSAAE